MKLREANIARNNARLELLGLTGLKASIAKSSKPSLPTKKRKKVATVTPTAPTRRSKRATSKPDRIQVGGKDYWKSERVWGADDDDHDTSSYEGSDDEPVTSKTAQDLARMKEEMELLRTRISEATSEANSSTSLSSSSGEEGKFKGLSIKLWGNQCSPPFGCSWKVRLNLIASPSPPSDYNALFFNLLASLDLRHVAHLHPFPSPPLPPGPPPGAIRQ